MPTPSERQALEQNAYMMALSMQPNLIPEVVESLPLHLKSFLWNIECLANAAPEAVTIEHVVPGFGLLICKTPNWTPETQAEGCYAISSEQQAVLGLLLSKLAETILPDVDKPTYQHFETADGLICALYRMTHRRVVLAAAGLEDVNALPLVNSTSVH